MSCLQPTAHILDEKNRHFMIVIMAPCDAKALKCSPYEHTGAVMPGAKSIQITKEGVAERRQVHQLIKAVQST